MKVRVRFGIKGASWFFPNACVFVIPNVNRDQFMQLSEFVMNVKTWLTINGRDDLAQRVVCEES